MITYSDRGKVKIKGMICHIFVVFLLTTILKVCIKPMNLILTIFLIALFFYDFYKKEVFKKNILFYVYSVFLVIMNATINNFHFYKTNEIFYFPLLILCFMFFLKYQNDSITFLRNHKRYVDSVVVLWGLMMIASLPFSIIRVHEGEARGFVFFTETTFLFCAISIFVFTLLAIQYNLRHRKKYIIIMFVLSLCIMSDTIRNHFSALACSRMFFLYTQIKNKRMYFIETAIVAVTLLRISFFLPIKQKFIESSSQTEVDIDSLVAFISGWPIFWAHDILTMIENILEVFDVHIHLEMLFKKTFLRIKWGMWEILYRRVGKPLNNLKNRVTFVAHIQLYNYKSITKCEVSV